MKMSEVFMLPIKPMRVLGASHEKDEAAAHAINCHDELVEALESTMTMLAALQKEQGLKPTEYAIGLQVKEALAKAK